MIRCPKCGYEIPEDFDEEDEEPLNITRVDLKILRGVKP